MPRRLPLVILAVVGACLLLAVGIFPSLCLAGRFLIVADPIVQPVDAVVVLSGGDLRIPYAAELFRSQGADWFVITETGKSIPTVRESISAQDAALAVDRGVPEDAIFVTGLAELSTIGEAEVVRQFAEAEGVRSMIVVTDPFHTRRTRMVFRRAFHGLDIDLMVRPVAGHPFQSCTWWMDAGQRANTLLEYGKLAGSLFIR
jgi:uncharacterized SAM-binding protein YcdF (DUF218 family)